VFASSRQTIDQRGNTGGQRIDAWQAQRVLKFGKVTSGIGRT
jgi:hypothetical protein